MRTLIRWILGVSLIAIGIVGLFLPFIQGIACIVAGVAVLGCSLAYVQRALAWLEPRAPFGKPIVHWCRERVDRYQSRRAQASPDAPPQ